MKAELCYLEKVSGVSKCVPIHRLYSVLLSHCLFVRLVAIKNSIWLGDCWPHSEFRSFTQCCCSSWGKIHMELMDSSVTLYGFFYILPSAVYKKLII